MLNLGKSLLIAFGAVLAVSEIGFGQVTPVAPAQPNTQLPAFAFDQLQSRHSEDFPLFVLQGEMDDLIGPDGGGACPLAAGLTTESDRQANRNAERVAEAQPTKRQSISNASGLQSRLDLQVTRLGWEVPSRLVCARQSNRHRADEGHRQNAA